jgi:TonB family protein
MIAAWMLAASVFALLAGVAALAAEHVLRARGRAARGVWLFALAAAVTWPVVVPVARAFRSSATPSTSVIVGPVTIAATTAALEVPPSFLLTLSTVVHDLRASALQGASRVASLVGLSLGDALLILWGAMSVWLFAQLLTAARRVQAITASATPQRVDGEPVLVSASFGPASVGWRAPRIVLPTWVLALDAPLRTLVLEHEREHCRAADPRAVWLAAIGVALVPWNAAVWWIARRLRLAIELDCDARTLASAGKIAGPFPGPRDAYATYGKLLLFMAQQHALGGPPLRLASSLASSRSHLHRRITAMQQSHTGSSSGRARRQRAMFGALAVAAIVAACSTDIPGSVAAPASPADAKSPSSRVAEGNMPVAAPSAESVPMPSGLLSEASAPYFEFQVERPATMLGAIPLRYPPMLRTAQVEGRVLAQFVVRADGRVDPSTFEVLRAEHAAFAEAVRQALSSARYQPAEVGGRAVDQVVQQPFVFALERSSQVLRSTDGGTATVLGRAWEGVMSPWRPDVADAFDTKPDTYFEFQVDEPASMQGNAGLRYPAELRRAGVEGTVLVHFELGVDGRADMSTFRVLKSDHHAFTEAVRAVLPGIRYTAARKDGRVVRQVVQQPFVFQLAR